MVSRYKNFASDRSSTSTFNLKLKCRGKHPDLTLIPQFYIQRTKIRVVGKNSGLLVDVLPGPNKQRVFESSMLLS
jgi:hypothetical protein